MSRLPTSALVLWSVLIIGAPRVAAQAASDSTILQALPWRSLGPASMGGRVVDIEAVERDFTQVLVASASGGVFASKNAGITWTPIFDRYPSASIGDVAIFQPNPDIIWVGTGEANNRNSVSWGDGIYKSTDGGRTFARMGLESTRQIARVLTHPRDPELVYVCAVGYLWSSAGDRGLFRTTDGGRTWTRLGGGLPADGKTGCTDLVADPRDPAVLYTAFYERIRRPWTFVSGGPNGGIFKSVNGGRTWQRLSRGLPPGPTGRIGLAVSRSRPDVVMAIVEAQRSDSLSRPGSGIYRSEDGGTSWRYVNTYNNRPFYYSQIRINPIDDRKVYVLTTRLMVSSDGGKTLTNGSEDQEIHGDFHAMWLDPTDRDRYYVGMDKGLALTHDGGRAFLWFDNLAIGQYYRIGVDMRDPYYIYGGLQDNGSFAGPSFSRDVRGVLNDDVWKMHWGDGQDVQIDPTDWRKVYTSSENGRFKAYDPLTHQIADRRPDSANVTNNAEVARRAGVSSLRFRFNWSAPLVMSPHDPAVIYLGGNYLFRTRDAGVSWTIISPDLTTDDSAKWNIRHGGLTPDNSGAEMYSSATSVAESPVAPGVIWFGSDDGNLQVTRDGGATWTDVRPNVPRVPARTWVSRVEASRHEAGRAYVAFDGHRDDAIRPWIFRTRDFGATWTEITGDLPERETVLVVREDPVNPDLLFAGTESGAWATLDGGRHWQRIGRGLPTVAVQDLVIHPRDHDLIAATHGRSLWILDDITPLEQMTPEVRARPVHLFEQRVATLWENLSRGGQRGHFWFGGANRPDFLPAGSLPRASHRNVALLSYWVGSTAGDSVSLEITGPGGARRTARLEGSPGLHRWAWDLRLDPVAGAKEGELAGPGSYRLALTGGSVTSRGVLVVRADPLLR